MPKRKTKPAPTPPPIKVDDLVLMGGSRASYPGYWYMGRVLWIGEVDVLIERGTMNGQAYRQLCLVSEVRGRRRHPAARRRPGEGA